MFIPDLTNCDKEPIHIPGKIQSHGFLISIDRSFRIAFCSENISTFLPVSAASLLNQPLLVIDKYLKNNNAGFIIQLIKSGENNKGLENSKSCFVNINGDSFNLVISPSNDYYLLEFEPELSEVKLDLDIIVNKSISEILVYNQLSELLNKSAEEVRKIIGYDRVMIYKFHEDGHGEVVAEDKNEELPPLMGLHYPASDIPKQARELYKINLVRLIADVNKESSDIITINELLDVPLDLTHSILRAVSPMHIQYLKNMGVASSFSISLIHNNELWGLVACHNYSPLFIHYKEREAANLIGKVLSATLRFQQQEEDQQQNHKLKIAVEILAKQLLQFDTIENALLLQEVNLLDAVNSTGAVLVIDQQIYTCGKTPHNIFLEELIEWLNESMQDQIYVTNSLPPEFQPAQNHKEIISGLLAIRLSKELNDYIIWLRPEVISNVNWAGDPDKPMEFTTNGLMQISPRKSFETWSQTVLNTSLPWENEDIRSALHLKEEVSSTIIRKAAETRQLNEQLNKAYNALDTFSYTISHDLKNPLTAISVYSQMLAENVSLDPEARMMVARILSGADKMHSMIRHILNYSHIGQSEIEFKRVNMDKLLNEIRQELLVASHNTQPQIIINDTPEIFGDEIMVMQVFSNLVSNAVKYSGKTQNPVVIINGKNNDSVVQYSISDNGIGINPSERESIFDLFTRSPNVKDYEGSGVGLSIVKKIMEKHQGKVWVESDGKTGSIFYVSFNKPEAK